MVSSSVLTEFQAIWSHGDPIHVNVDNIFNSFAISFFLFHVFSGKSRSHMASQANPSCRKDS